VCGIVLDGDTKETRCQLIQKFVEIAGVQFFFSFFDLVFVLLMLIPFHQHCVNLKNFNGLFGIMGGLQHAALERLAETWAVSKSTSFLVQQLL
jgi:hypothetical protein